MYEFFHVFMHFLIVVSLLILVLEVYLLKNKQKKQTVQAETSNPPRRFEPSQEKETK